jgi:hypothetical protein
MAWWQKENEENFRAINKRLPGLLQILESSDPVATDVKFGPVIYRTGTVRCVWLPRKKSVNK